MKLILNIKSTLLILIHRDVPATGSKKSEKKDMEDIFSSYNPDFSRCI